MTPRRIVLALALMLSVSVTAAVLLVLYARSDEGASAIERLERSPDWRGIGTYTVPGK